ncbi:unnamed protein product [Allacma fusca]|uniref:Uncharacterized protein n=1 Tax=Allacma fusca TaxID=39272 RepID=A0A8J2PAE4_9HEXA|nr:unnamed protein product [Allacma fusca]
MDGKTLSISPDDIYSYHKLPIVDCFFSKEEVTVTLNVPIKRQVVNWCVFDIILTKFANNNQVRDLYPQDVKLLAVGIEKVVLID